MQRVYEYVILLAAIVFSLGLSGCTWYFFKDDRAGKLSLLAAGCTLGMALMLFLIAFMTK